MPRSLSLPVSLSLSLSLALSLSLSLSLSIGGFYFAPVVEMINLVMSHVGITNLRLWVTSEGM